MKVLNVPDYAEDITLFEEFVPTTSRLSAKDKADTVQFLLDNLNHVTDKFGPQKNEAYHEKRALLHAAVNVLEPGFFNQVCIAKLDALLQTELHERAVVEGGELAQSAALDIQGTCVALWQGDITTLRIDAIVNAANDRLLGCFQPLHTCIDNAIHTRAGVQLRDDCWVIMQKQQMSEPTGIAKVTRAYNLPSKFVIHTVGPIVQGDLTSRHEEALRKSYLSCLDICASLPQIQSVAFCCISTGVFGYPYDRAATTAFHTVCDWLTKHPVALEYVVFNVFTDRDRLMYESLMVGV